MLLLPVKKMSGQVRRKGRFIKNKTLDYEVRRNSGLVDSAPRSWMKFTLSIPTSLELIELNDYHCL